MPDKRVIASETMKISGGHERQTIGARPIELIMLSWSRLDAAKVAAVHQGKALLSGKEWSPKAAMGARLMALDK